MTAHTIIRETLHGVTAESHPGNPDVLHCTDCRRPVERVEWTNGAADYRGDRGFANVPDTGDLHRCPPRTIEQMVEDPTGFLATALAPIGSKAAAAAVEAAIRRAFIEDAELSLAMTAGY